MPAALRDHPMLVHVQGSLLADVSAAVLPADMPISARVGSLVVGFIGLLLLHKIASICAVNVGCRTTAEVARLEEDRLIMSCYEKVRCAFLLFVLSFVHFFCAHLLFASLVHSLFCCAKGTEQHPEASPHDERRQNERLKGCRSVVDVDVLGRAGEGGTGREYVLWRRVCHGRAETVPNYKWSYYYTVRRTGPRVGAAPMRRRQARSQRTRLRLRAQPGDPTRTSRNFQALALVITSIHTLQSSSLTVTHDVTHVRTWKHPAFVVQRTPLYGLYRSRCRLRLSIFIPDTDEFGTENFRIAVMRSSVVTAALSSAESSKMLGGASQIVSMIRVICNGT